MIQIIFFFSRPFPPSGVKSPILEKLIHASALLKKLQGFSCISNFSKQKTAYLNQSTYNSFQNFQRMKSKLVLNMYKSLHTLLAQT
jgi:hypothetical protein